MIANATSHSEARQRIEPEGETAIRCLTPLPMGMHKTADMIPDSVGIGLLHCHMPGHLRTRFQVLPK
jgi:hypothetical protein